MITIIFVMSVIFFITSGYQRKIQVLPYEDGKSDTLSTLSSDDYVKMFTYHGQNSVKLAFLYLTKGQRHYVLELISKW